MVEHSISHLQRYLLKLRVATCIGCLCAASPALAIWPPPRFDQPQYFVDVDVRPPGLQSFELTGFAVDSNENEVLTLYLTAPRPWSRFSYVPGNPATFSFRGVGLGYQHIGTYVFGVVAYDNVQPIADNAALVTVRVFPEPVTIGAIGCALVVTRRTRRS